MYNNIKIYNGIDSEPGDEPEVRVITGQRTAKEDVHYYWNPARYKKPTFIDTQPNRKRISGDEMPKRLVRKPYHK